ncbi:MAG: hypothetical protein INR69_07225 [Mucilaginibacter polytrichastri]|nr:hypothetical protein [Mucilaginibacter polytrichastri]
MRVQNGNTRVFRYNQTFTSITASMRDLLFSVPMSDNRFEIGNAEITSGRVVYRHICPACNTIDLKPAGGIIKGQKADGNRWLIDATVYLKADLPGQAVSDTLHVKQYFIPGEVN